MPAHEQNRRAWNRRVRERERFTEPATDEDFRDPLTAVGGAAWLGGDVRGKRVLCLGAGGGRQGPLFAAAGATTTVVDISSAMLAIDREVAHARGLPLTVIEGSMDDLSALSAAAFDLVSQPVSTCYVPDISRVYREVARVTAPDGIYVSQHKQPTSLQAEVRMSSRGYVLEEPYYRDSPLPEVQGSPHREPGTLEYLHRWEELLGGLCRAGFVIEDVLEPRHADFSAAIDSFAHRCCYLPPYVRIKARRGKNPLKNASASRANIWLP